ncbi:hypothetical protein [Streptomyces sp. NPDC001507]|uniref:hypothetical protein n=1 Tax=Streptomyces sp. NPDC001507 TaxID=3364579 RepID=UPI0036A03AB0
MAYATQAVAMVGRRLPVAHADGSDLEARAGPMLGADLTGPDRLRARPGARHRARLAPPADGGWARAAIGAVR